MRPLAALLLLSAAAVAQPAGRPDGRRPPLYLVEHEGAKLYLLGSVHVLPEGDLPLPPHVEGLFDAASTVAFEVVGDGGDDGFEMLAAASDEATIADLLDDSQLAALHAALRRYGWPGRALDRVEPWYAALRFAALGPDSAALGEGVDTYLHRRAVRAGKTVLSLETQADQIAAFDHVPEAEQVAYLMALIEGPTTTSATFEALVAAWGAGDEQGVWHALIAEIGEGALFESLLLRRNQAWLPAIRALLDRPGEVSMVVVGAGHLVGPGSVLALLRQAGFKAQRR